VCAVVMVVMVVGGCEGGWGLVGFALTERIGVTCEFPCVVGDRFARTLGATPSCSRPLSTRPRLGPAPTCVRQALQEKSPVHFELLQLFAFGTFAEYRGREGTATDTPPPPLPFPSARLDFCASPTQSRAPHPPPLTPTFRCDAVCVEPVLALLSLRHPWRLSVPSRFPCSKPRQVRHLAHGQGVPGAEAEAALPCQHVCDEEGVGPACAVRLKGLTNIISPHTRTLTHTPESHSVSNHGAAFGMHVPARGVLPSRFEGPIVGRKVGPLHVIPRVWALRLCEKVLPYAEIQAECDLADDAAVRWRLAALS
jgi:hypothetical protein